MLTHDRPELHPTDDYAAAILHELATTIREQQAAAQRGTSLLDKYGTLLGNVPNIRELQTTICDLR